MTLNNQTCAGSPDAETTRHIHHIALGVNKIIIPPYKIEDAFLALQDDLTRLLGGITAWESQGTWTPRAEFGDYHGTIERDVTLNFLLTMTVKESAQVWPDIQSAIAKVVLAHGIGCEHIHTMVWPAQSRIFRVSDVALNPANQNESYHGSNWLTGDTRKKSQT